MQEVEKGVAIPYADPLRALLVRADHGSTTDAVTDALREGILSGVLEPATWLREDELAVVLGVSRTPVREALRRLSDEGLTQRVANRGTVVPEVTLDEILAVYAVRESLEGLAARSAAIRRPPGFVERMHGIYQQMVAATDEDPAVMAALGLEFHAQIRQAAGNPYLDRFLTQVDNAIRRFGKTTISQPGRMTEALEEHFGILEAIAAGDPDSAERRATKHMRRDREVQVAQLLSM